MEIQKKSQSNLEKEEKNWRNQAPWLHITLQSYNNQESMLLAQKQKYSSMDRIKSPEIKLCTYGNSIYNKGSDVRWSHSVMSDSLRPHGLEPARLLCPWHFLGKSTGVGCHSLLQGIFLAQGSNLGLPHCRQTLYHLSHQGSPWQRRQEYNVEKRQSLQ